MIYNFINKSTHILLLLTLVSHLTVFHNLLDNYVVCYGSDGHIAIENVNECDECSYIQLNDFTKSIELSSQNCEDVALDENCFEDAEFISKYKVIISANILQLVSIFENAEYEKEFNYNYINHEFENPILGSYTSVSLLI